MLTQLRIFNFALIQEQVIAFTPGLNVISGETGSGKSLILSALQFLLGQKTKQDLIRDGSDSLEVEGLFCLGGIPQEMREEFPILGASNEFLVSRSLSRSGKSKLFLNGRLGSLSLLQEISAKLVNFCGQHSSVSLLDPKYHLEYLDNYANLDEDLKKYGQVFKEWKNFKSELEEGEESRVLAEKKKNELQECLKELDGVTLRPGFRGELEQRVKELNNAAKILEIGQGVIFDLSEEKGVLRSVENIGVHLQELGRISSRYLLLSQYAINAAAELRELDRELNALISRVEVDEDTLRNLSDELNTVARLQRKYCTDETGLMELKAKWEDELQGYETFNLKSIQEKERLAWNQVFSLAEMLHDKRKEARGKLSKVIRNELKQVNIPDASFEIMLEEGEYSIRGKDKTEFFISTNKGESPKKLREVASGGELSRITLVLKEVLRDKVGINILVFDEVDSGISGGAARAVGEKLKSLSQGFQGRGSQVICITHLPQVASLADHHLLVQKEFVHNESEKRTLTLIKEIGEEERVEEIARMLAGYTITEASRESARELLSSNA